MHTQRAQHESSLKMANTFKTEAEVRAEKAAAAKKAGGGALDHSRKLELDGHLKRLASVTAVFQMRAETVPVPQFRLIRELMDIYMAGGVRALSEGQDFIDQGIKLSDQETRDVHKLMRDIFNVDAGEAAAEPEKK
jgi:hypothetical protein